MSGTYETCEQASRDYQDTRTRDQQKWDRAEYDLAEMARGLKRQTEKQIGWARDPQTLECVDRMLSKAVEQIKYLRMVGSREGDPAGPIPELKSICAPPRIDVFETTAEERASILRPFGDRSVL